MKHLLVIRLSALGDVAMTLPVLYSLAERYPETRFTLLTQPAAARLLLNAPANLTAWPADIRGRHKGIPGLFRLFRELRGRQIDGVADLHDVLRSRFLRTLFRLRGIPVAVIDKGRAEKQALIRQNGRPVRPLRSTFQRYREVFDRLGLPAELRFTSLFGDKKGDPARFADLTPPKREKPWIGIAPFAKHPGKTYPPQQMEQVVRQLAETGRYTLFLLGGPEESNQLEQWAERYPDTRSVAGKKLGFEIELALISHFDLMLSMDSANMHLASLVNVPVLSIWGATHPAAGFLGWNQSPERALSVDLPCRPCSVFGNKPCRRGDYACLYGVTPEQVVKQIHRHLSPEKSNT